MKRDGGWSQEVSTEAESQVQGSLGMLCNLCPMHTLRALWMNPVQTGTGMGAGEHVCAKLRSNPRTKSFRRRVALMLALLRAQKCAQRPSAWATSCH